MLRGNFEEIKKHKFDNNQVRFQRMNLPFVGIKTDT
jgi:hypothetical protein